MAIDTIKFSQFTNSGDLEPNQVTVGLEAGANTRFSNPFPLLAPGSTGDRPIPDPSMYFRLRFNTTLESYEYFSSVLFTWVQLEDSADLFDGPFLIYQEDPGLPGAFNLGALTTGILKQTVTLGVATPSIAVNGTDYFGPGFVVPPEDGGTGVNNGTNTLTLAGNLETAGAFDSVFTMTAATNVTFPVSGTLATVGDLPDLGDFVFTGDTMSVATMNADLNIIPNGSGQTLIGSDVALGTPSPNLQQMQIAQDDSQGEFRIFAFNNDVTASSLTLGKSRSTVVGDHVIVQNGDQLGIISYVADTGTDYVERATITAEVDGSPGANIPTRILFSTSGANSGGATALTISSTQQALFANNATFGSSGVAGAVTSFPAGASLGSLQLAATNNSGNFANVLTNLSTTAARTWSLPDATGTIALTSGASGIVSSGSINQLTWYAASGTTVSGLATANNGLLVTSATGVPSIGNAILADITVNGLTVGSGAFSSTSNTALGLSALGANVSGIANVAVGSMALSSLTTGNSTVSIGAGSGTSGGFGVNITTGTRNTFIGNSASGNNAAASGVIAIGCFTVADMATGVTSADNGPGIAIGSSTTPVGFRGDGTIYPSTTGAGFWRPKINGTYYNIPMFADGSTGFPAITAPSITFNTTSGIIGTTTNNNAAVGSVGEYQETILLSSGSLIPIASTTPTNIVQLTNLSAGDWDVWGTGVLDVTGISTITSFVTWISSTSATQPNIVFTTRLENQNANNTDIALPAVMRRFSLSAPTTIYLQISSVYTGGTVNGFGAIYARRAR